MKIEKCKLNLTSEESKLLTEVSTYNTLIKSRGRIFECVIDSILFGKDNTEYLDRIKTDINRKIEQCEHAKIDFNEILGKMLFNASATIDSRESELIHSKFIGDK